MGVVDDEKHLWSVDRILKQNSNCYFGALFDVIDIKK